MIDATARPVVTPLAGGVSCDVFRVELPDRTLCVKQALSQLRVAAEWFAPLERSHSEVLWLETAAEAGIAVPRIVAELRRRHLFVMDYLDPGSHPLWKAELAAQRVDRDFAASVGRALVRVHAATAGSSEIAARFANDEIFAALRIDAYLVHAAAAHPDLQARVTAIAERTRATRLALVHGDISPKNILCGPHGPVFLDAEPATYGDPAFDLAFCLTHLLLKAVWKPASTAAYAASFEALRAAYFTGLDWEAADGFDARAADLLAAIVLARVDGKSPVEYLDELQRTRVRSIARTLLARPALSLAGVAATWAEYMGRI